MVITNFHYMKIMIHKQYELFLALHVVYLLKHPELREEFDFVEIPNIDYVKELEQLIPIEHNTEVISYIMNYQDSSFPILFSIGLNDSYQIDENKMQIEQVKSLMNYGTLEELTKELERIAKEIHWDDFFQEHLPLYQEFVNQVCIFPKDLDLSDLSHFYSTSQKTYIVIPSFLMNGGFGVEDRNENMYYVKGFQYCKEKNNFHVDPEYFVECMFHEFSHPIVNPIVYRYFKNTELLNQFYEVALKRDLPFAYRQPSVLLCEYLVRANAYLLTKTYFNSNMHDWIIDHDWLIDHGFSFLPDCVSFTQENLPQYENYEKFVQNAIPMFLEHCLECAKKKDK